MFRTLVSWDTWLRRSTALAGSVLFLGGFRCFPLGGWLSAAIITGFAVDYILPALWCFSFPISALRSAKKSSMHFGTLSR